jgi:hypothetical protein
MDVADPTLAAANANRGLKPRYEFCKAVASSIIGAHIHIFMFSTINFF